MEHIYKKIRELIILNFRIFPNLHLPAFSNRTSLKDFPVGWE